MVRRYGSTASTTTALGSAATVAASASVGSAATAPGCGIVSAAIAAAIHALLAAGTVGACVAALAVVAKPTVSAAIAAVSVTTYLLAVVRAGAWLGRRLVSAASLVSTTGLVSAAEVRLLRWTRCAAAGIGAVAWTLVSTP